MYIWTDLIPGKIPDILLPYVTKDILWTYAWINEAVLLRRRLTLKTIECDSWKERSHRQDIKNIFEDMVNDQ